MIKTLPLSAGAFSIAPFDSADLGSAGSLNVGGSLIMLFLPSAAAFPEMPAAVQKGNAMTF